MGFGALLVRRRSTSGHSVERCCSTSSSPALRRLRRPGEGSMRTVRRRPASPRRASLRSLRRPYLVAGRALPRVLGAADRLRHRPRRSGLRRPGPRAGRRLEGARPAQARRAGRRAPLRGRPPPAVVHADLRPGRPQPPARAWAQPRRAPGERDRCPLDLPAAPSCPGDTASLRSGVCLSRAATQRARCVPATGVAPRTLVLVDDVSTTGATRLGGGDRARKAGARRIEVVTFARGVR